MKENKFRNHITIVLENMGTVFFALAAFVLTQGAEILADIMQNGVKANEALITVGVIVGLALVIFAWRMRVWSLTWIIIDEDTISIERRTILNKKNTIGLKNISNVNTEQNLFERLIGTCKVKLDTNSLSTANKNDVSILLKKEDGEELRKYLVRRIKELNTGEILEEDKNDVERTYDVESSAKEIFFHGLYSINMLVIIIFISSVAGVVEVVKDMMHAGSLAGGIASVAASFMTLAVILFTSVSSMVKGFVDMFDFRASREEDRIYLSYGLLKKVNYAIPLDKINGISIRQTMVARIFRRYSAELINVGMGDDEKRSISFVFYMPKERMEKIFQQLLPEFADSLDWKIERQPRNSWIYRIVRAAFSWGIVIGAGYLGITLIPAIPYTKYYGFVVLGLILLIAIVMILGYFTNGTDINEEFLTIARGSLGKQYVIMKYDKIQYAQFNQNFITKRFGISTGLVTLLAAAQYKTQEIPYFQSDKIDFIRDKLLG